MTKHAFTNTLDSELLSIVKGATAMPECFDSPYFHFLQKFLSS